MKVPVPTRPCTTPGCDGELTPCVFIMDDGEGAISYDTTCLKCNACSQLGEGDYRKVVQWAVDNTDIKLMMT